MEEWRALAYRAQNTLASFVSGTKAADFLRLVNAATMNLATENYYILRRLQMGPTNLDLNAIPRPPPSGDSPMYLIERARLQFEALRREYALASNIIALCGSRQGLLQGNPLWQAWVGHHFIATLMAEEALNRLRDAASSCQAAADAMAMAISLPPPSPAACVAWVSEAQSLTRHTISEVTTARDMAILMCDAVILEYVAACMVLNG